MKTFFIHAFAIWFALSACAAHAQRETPEQMRRIVVQSVCLGVAYPNSIMAKDSAEVITLYQEALGPSLSARKIAALKALAEKEKPSAPTPVGAKNLAIAKCVLFADQPDVRKLLK
jgi:hypothetical protein